MNVLAYANDLVILSRMFHPVMINIMERLQDADSPTEMKLILHTTKKEYQNSIYCVVTGAD